MFSDFTSVSYMGSGATDLRPAEAAISADAECCLATSMAQDAGISSFCWPTRGIPMSRAVQETDLGFV